MSERLRPSEQRARRRAEKERAVGLEPDDEAARWLAQHDAAPEPAAPKAAAKSKLLHRWRQQHRPSS